MNAVAGLAILGLLCSARAFAQADYVQNFSAPGSFPIVQHGAPAVLLVDTNDWAGVARAAGDLRADIARVTGCTAKMAGEEPGLGTHVILIGTLGRSRPIDRLVRDRKLDVSQIAGKWESFVIQVVPDPLPGVASGLVIAGSDKRGTLYGIYDVSEEIGVSPWYWWADVPIRHRAELFAKAGRYMQGPPAVQYRGIFLNDEAPSLTGWVKEKYGDYNHGFYTNVFELLLRLKANYLWSAMWNNCFSEDDPLNPKLADEYGIVMGTSHAEPMMRADKEWNREGHTADEWNFATHPAELRAFWKAGIERNQAYENIVTLGMRGKIDSPMSESANIALLQQIVAEQRLIISDAIHTNSAAIPQLWALYKEVQEYYEKGMRVPEDVVLLWCDDNWGNLRRLPTPEEQRRSGGAGIYYHLDYVGSPRNYKWVNTVPIAKIREQMNLAYHYGANRIWMVNVGGLKLKEFPTEFFLKLAWDPERWPKEKIQDYTRLWAAREFGPAHARDIADIVSKYTKYNGRRKPELLDPATFSLVDYQEADRVMADWKSITAAAERIDRSLPPEARDAFFELVLYPVKACEQVNDLYITVAKNRMAASQGRAGANDLAARARELFQADADLSACYNHVLSGGKWDHIMDQTHIGYSSWQQPTDNIMPRVAELAVPAKADMGVAVEGSTSAWPGATEEALLPEFDVFNRPRHYIDIFNKGRTPFRFSAAVSAPWILVAPAVGVVEKEQRLWVAVDWSKAPGGSQRGLVKITGAGAEPVPVNVEMFNPPAPKRDVVKGYVEAGGCVSIEAEHYTRKIDSSLARWERLEGLGRTGSSMSIFPVTAASTTPPRNSPCLEYRMYVFDAGTVEVEAVLAPTLNFMPGRGLRFAVSFDDQPPAVLTAVPEGYVVDNGNRDWERSVADSVRVVRSTLGLEHPGCHTLKVWMVDPGIVIEKLVLDFGGVKPSCLGPPESYRGD